MLSNIGNFLLILNIFLSFLIIYSSFNCLKSSNNLISKNIYWLLEKLSPSAEELRLNLLYTKSV